MDEDVPNIFDWNGTFLENASQIVTQLETAKRHENLMETISIFEISNFFLGLILLACGNIQYSWSMVGDDGAELTMTDVYQCRKGRSYGTCTGTYRYRYVRYDGVYLNSYDRLIT